MRRMIAALLLCLISIPSLAQEITFTAETTSGNGQVVPVLTWSTEPAADSCIASGGWSGEKGASGSETLPATQSSATYNLTCTWAADNDVTLTWDNPTQNTDGSPYTDPGHTLIEYSPDGQDPWFMQVVDDPGDTSAVVPGLEPGDWTFRAYAVNQADVSSDASNTTVVVVEPASTDEETIGIQVNPQPGPVTNLRGE